MEESLLSFVKTASPLSVIALLALIIFQMAKSGGILSRLRGTQISDKQTVSEKADTDAFNLISLNKKLDKIAENHLHELPDIKKAVDRIETEQIRQGNRLTSVETTIKILLKQ